MEENNICELYVATAPPVINNNLNVDWPIQLLLTSFPAFNIKGSKFINKVKLKTMPSEEINLPITKSFHRFIFCHLTPLVAVEKKLVKLYTIKTNQKFFELNLNLNRKI
ncbi:hypothetical protein SAP269_01070 [Spiroplasma ixodetis]|uniref:Uncharacterized protein n=1 Tax=Spiroplasma ixodetis TaxID=2141 RepID=A0ABM8JJX8_9MOLU